MIIDNSITPIKYIENTIILVRVKLLKSLFRVPWIIFRDASNGKIWHINENTSPTLSFGKYIPLVKHTNWTTILPSPPVPFSLTRLPIKIPKAIKNIDIIIDTKIVRIILIVNSNPKIIANTKNKISWINIIGIIDKIYPSI